MEFFRVRFCWSLLALATLGQILSPLTYAVQHPSPGSTSAEDQPPAQLQDYIIGPDDLLDVRVFEQAEIGGKVRVSAQGFIRLPFIGQVKAAGYTESQLVDVLREKLLVLLRDPQVSVFIDEHKNQQVSVLGYVRNPGRYPISQGTRLLTVLAQAGGPVPAAGDLALIIRGSSLAADKPEAGESGQLLPGVETVNLRKLFGGDPRVNPVLFAGDVVSVPEADKVFLTGNVNSAGAFDLRSDLTLRQAITLAGGFKPGAKKDKIIVVRQEPNKSQKTELVVNFSQIEKKQGEDLALRANDVVFVPSSTARVLGNSMLNALTLQTATFLPYLLIRR